MESDTRPADLQVLFELIEVSHAGQPRTVYSDYRPQYAIRDDYHTSARHVFPDNGAVTTGQRAKALVWLLTPEVYPACMWVGRIVEVFEGSRAVGRATVVRVLNPVLVSLDLP